MRWPFGLVADPPSWLERPGKPEATEPDTSTDPDPAPVVDADPDHTAERRALRLAEAVRKAGEQYEMHDPSDVHQYFTEAELLTDDGLVDDDHVERVINDLVIDKPHLRKTYRPPSTRVRFGEPRQLTRDEVSRLTPDEINRAHAAGLLDHVLRGQGQ